MIKVVCYVKEYSGDPDSALHQDICVESLSNDAPSILMQSKKIMITIGKQTFIVNAEDMIEAINNCMNNNN